jgi:hypothetical protein
MYGASVHFTFGELEDRCSFGGHSSGGHLGVVTLGKQVWDIHLGIYTSTRHFLGVFILVFNSGTSCVK